MASGLSHLPCIGQGAIRAAEMLPEWLCEPPILRLLDQSIWTVDDMHRCFPAEITDATGERLRILSSLRSARSVEEVRERTSRLRLRLLPEPEFPFAPTARLIPLRSATDLAREGHTMRHCLSDLILDMLTGQAAFFHWSGTASATVEIRPRGGQWHLSRVAGRANVAVAADEMGAIVSDLSALGIVSA